MTDTGPVIEALKRRVRAWIEERFGATSSRAAMLELLGARGLALHPDAPCRAGVLTAESYRAVRGELDGVGLTAAAAVELRMNAAFVLDDIVDSLGPADPETLAIALQLLAGGDALAGEAARADGRSGSGFAPLAEFHRNWAVACEGFFLDAHLTRRDAWSLDDALDMTVKKSGALGRFAAAFGAGIAAEAPALIARLGEVGESIFTYRQLVDDLRDACAPADGTSDLSRGKKTVPLIYFHNHLRRTRSGHHGARLDPSGPEAVRAYEDSGAPIYGAIVAEAFLNRAKAGLAALGADRVAVRNIERWVATIEAGSCDAVPP